MWATCLWELMLPGQRSRTYRMYYAPGISVAETIWNLFK